MACERKVLDGVRHRRWERLLYNLTANSLNAALIDRELAVAHAPHRPGAGSRTEHQPDGER